MTLKQIWGEGAVQDLGGLCPSGPNVEPPLMILVIISATRKQSSIEFQFQLQLLKHHLGELERKRHEVSLVLDEVREISVHRVTLHRHIRASLRVT